ncbi:PIR protein, putative [Plasmodium sp.]|nr:PIR protein, putative [Plasmodium sp.]
MKVHYINILLFALLLNILETLFHAHNQRNHNNSTPHAPNNKRSKSDRTLCECELYAPSNYDNDPEMKEIMKDFDHQTSQRFKEYDERMNKNREKCKHQCDKDIQKIILKNKIEKELTQQLSALETNINTNDIPTCVCEKSLADKTEKFCLNCGYGLGGGVLQSLGLFGGSGIYAWTIGATAAANKAAAEAGAAAGLKAGESMGFKTVISGLKALDIDKLCPGMLKSYFATRHYTDVSSLPNIIYKQYQTTCEATLASTGNDSICKIGYKLDLIANSGGTFVEPKVAIAGKLNGIVEEAKIAATEAVKTTTKDVTTKITNQKMSEIAATYMGYQTTIIASIVAILVIVLVMVIIYLILRYHRKKKMMKKLQYIKLLKE